MVIRGPTRGPQEVLGMTWWSSEAPGGFLGACPWSLESAVCSRIPGLVVKRPVRLADFAPVGKAD